MISCFLQGGLGNQLFQISTTLSFAWDNNIEPVFNFSTHHLPLQGNKANTYKDNLYRNLNPIEFPKYTKFSVYDEPNFYHCNIPNHIKKNNYILKGFFQSEKYFFHNRNKIIELFGSSKEIKNHIKKYENILKKNTCSVHIRRGDYIKFPKEHPILKMDYYRKSMGEFNKNTKFLIFSDDIKWCKDNLKGADLIFIDEPKDYINLFLMSLCDNNIIANSSFSWWGAWLNENPNKKVIAPKNWFGINKKLDIKDLIPNKWKKI